MAVPLMFSQVMGILNRTLSRLPDQRRGQNSQYTLQDAALSAFAVFFTQSPSFLAYQRAMQARQGRNNAGGLFGVKRIPSDAQVRNLLVR